MPSDANWTGLMLQAVEAAPTIEAGVTALLHYIHNEMANGTGLTQPQQVTKAALDCAEEVAAALQADPPPPAEEQAPPPPADPLPSSPVITTDQGTEPPPPPSV